MMTPAKTGSAAETAKPRQEGMTYSDSMDIVTPKAVGRARKPASSDSSTVVADEVSPKTGWGPTPGQRKRRRLLLLLLLLLLLPVSFWIGRSTVSPQVRVVEQVVKVPVIVTVALPVPAAPARSAVSKAAEAAPPAGSAMSATDAVQSETKLLQVSVGTGTRGGLTLVFDHPVEWNTLNAADGHAELGVEGVYALGIFPRNLPRPPGVKAIRAGITQPDLLTLSFDLKHGVQAYTFPSKGPAAAVNVYFRTPIEEAVSGDTMRAGPNGIPTGIGACGGASLASAKAMTLLQRSLDKDPAYAPVRIALAVLMTCNGNSMQAEQVVARGLKASPRAPATVTLAVVDASMLFARGDAAGAVQMLKTHAPAQADHGYDELMADLTAAAQ